MKTLHVMISAAAMTLALAGPAGAADLPQTTNSGGSSTTLQGNQQAQLQTSADAMTPATEEEIARSGTPNSDALADPFEGPEGSN